MPSSVAGRATESALDGPSYCRLVHDDHDHLFLPDCRPDTIIVTNMGQGQAIDQFLKNAGTLEYLTANGLIACYHERGSDELANRAIKDLGLEQLPFKRFAPNAAWYFIQKAPVIV